MLLAPRQLTPLPLLPPAPSFLLLQSEIAASRARSVHSSSLPLKSALWEYCWDARWTIFVCSLFFFLTAQASRQVGAIRSRASGLVLVLLVALIAVDVI